MPRGFSRVEVGGSDELPMWTVYENPADFPGQFVVRRSAIARGGAVTVDPAPCFVGATLAAARDALPHWRGLICMSRAPADPLAIVEVWL